MWLSGWMEIVTQGNIATFLSVPDSCCIGTRVRQTFLLQRFVSFYIDLYRLCLQFQVRLQNQFFSAMTLCPDGCVPEPNVCSLTSVPCIFRPLEKSP